MRTLSKSDLITIVEIARLDRPCRNDFSWPDNIKDGCSKREGVER